MILFHYTTKESYDEIWHTKEFKFSNPWTTMDSAFGTGWYFTDIDNLKCESFISYSCWRQAAFDRVRYYFKYDIDDSILTKCGRDHVYLVKNWQQSKMNLIDHGENKMCGKRPHENCAEYQKYFSQNRF